LVDLTLNTNQIIIAAAVVLYVVVISIAINKYHRNLERIKKTQTRFKHNYIDEIMLKEILSLSRLSIKNSKSLFYVLTIIIGLSHFITCLIIDTNLLSAGIPFLLFFLVLVGNYWLKGSSVASSLKNIPGTSEYRGL